MAAKRASKEPTKVSERRGPRGTTGPRGPRGKTGPAGPPGHNHTAEIARLAASVNEIVKELHVQLMRIAQIQAQLDRLASGQPPASSDDVSDVRNNH
jgi:hypothetical protein